MNEATSAEEGTLWSRRFAAAANNRAWDLSVQTRSAPEDQEMLDAAHASAWHWAKVGTELNRMRATMLLAEVHALLGLGQSALAYADEMRTYAHAASAAGEAEKHRAAYGLAVAALEAVSSEQERRIVASTFSHVPKPK